jgi:hypothetical protein
MNKKKQSKRIASFFFVNEFIFWSAIGLAFYHTYQCGKSFKMQMDIQCPIRVSLAFYFFDVEALQYGSG